MAKRIPKKDGSGKGTRANKGRGGCTVPESRGRGWFDQPERHALSSKGIPTTFESHGIGKGAYVQFGEQWDYPDAEYEVKTIDIDDNRFFPNKDKLYVELVYGTERGGEIRIWSDASKEDVEYARKLPHISTVSDGKFLEDNVQFMYYENAVEEYDNLNNAKKIHSIMWRNR